MGQTWQSDHALIHALFFRSRGVTSMADTSWFTTEECFISVWVHRKGRTGQTSEEIRGHILNRLNKTAPTESNLHKLERKTFETGFVLDAQHWKNSKIQEWQAPRQFRRIICLFTKKIIGKWLEEMQIPRASFQRVMKKKMGFTHCAPLQLMN